MGDLDAPSVPDGAEHRLLALKTYGEGVRQYLSWCVAKPAEPLSRAALNMWVAELLETGAAASTARSRGCDITARWRLGKNTIRVSMRRDCITEGGAFRAQTMIGAGDGTSGDPIDWTKRVRVGQE